MASFDAHLNFAYSLVATAPSPASSGTSLVVTAGQGSLFPAGSFNAVVWPAAANPTTTNAEIVRVTAISTDTLTITRTQESSSARTIVVGDQIAACLTAKSLTDIENMFPVSVANGGTGRTSVNITSTDGNQSNVTSAMMGFAASITPAGSGTVVFMASGVMYATGTNTNITATLKYGTGTAPTNGAATTGTTIGTGTQTRDASSGGAVGIPCTLIGRVTGLSAGTAYWFDVAMTGSGVNFSLSGSHATLIAFEL